MVVYTRVYNGGVYPGCTGGEVYPGVREVRYTRGVYQGGMLPYCTMVGMPPYCTTRVYTTLYTLGIPWISPYLTMLHLLLVYPAGVWQRGPGLNPEDN